jgi:hypothetical protein
LDDKFEAEKLRWVFSIALVVRMDLKCYFAYGRHDELARILERVVEFGLRGGWAEFQDTPLRIPLVQLAPYPHPPNSTIEPPSDPSPPNSKTDTPNPPDPDPSPPHKSEHKSKPDS